MGKRDLLPFGETLPEDMSFQDFLDQGVIDISEIDDVVAVEQGELVGKPFILFDWEVKESATYGGEYAVCRVKTADGTRVFADGGVGIVEALQRYDAKMKKGGIVGAMYFHYGLRFSTYQKEIDGKMTQATTYYFDNRPRP